jgi:hypothetical protein
MVGVGCGGSTLAPPDVGSALPVDAATATAALDAGEPDLAVTPDLGVDVAADTTPDVGAPARLVLEPGMQRFGGAIGCDTAPATFKVTNTGTEPSGALKVASDPRFVAVADACLGQVLPGGGSCTISLAFRPTFAGQAIGTLAVAAEPGGSVQSALTGNAFRDDDSLTIIPNSIDFGILTFGDTSAPSVLELRNTGGRDLQVDGVVISTDQFILTANECRGRALATAQSCQLSVVFKPSSLGSKSAILTVTTRGACTPGSIQAALLGTGVDAGGGLVINPSVVDFGDYCSSQPAVFRVSNIAANAGALQVQVTGPFGISSNTCNGALQMGKTCEVEVRLLNQGFGPVTGQLMVSTASGRILNASLSGRVPGMADPALVAPAIPSTTVGQKSAPVEVVVSLPVGAPAAKLFATITNVAAAEYTIIDNDCSQSIAGGTSCHLHIVFAPADTGVRNASLIVTAEGCPGGAGALQLTGVGLAP